MHDFTLSEEADRVTHIWVIGKAENIVIGGAGFLFSRHILMQIGDNIALGLEICHSKRRTRRRNGVDAGSVVNEVSVEAACLYLLDGQPLGKLVENGGDHFNVRQFFCTNICQNAFYLRVRHGETLVEIPERCSKLSVRTTRWLWDIVNFSAVLDGVIAISGKTIYNAGYVQSYRNYLTISCKSDIIQLSGKTELML